MVGGDDDYSHAFYISTGTQTPDAPAGNFEKLYEWSEGTLSLVSVKENDEPFTTASQMPGTHRGTVSDNLGTVSDDGERAYFTNQADIYLREGGVATLKVSESECTSGCGGESASAVFLRATPNGERVLFTSTDKLTDESSASGAKLYRWDRNAPPGGHLVDLTVDKEPGDGDNPGAADIFGTSEDGDTVYFLASGRLVTDQDPSTKGDGRKVYRGASTAAARRSTTSAPTPATSTPTAEAVSARSGRGWRST